MCESPPVSSAVVSSAAVSSHPAAFAFTLQDKDGKVAGKVIVKPRANSENVAIRPLLRIGCRGHDECGVEVEVAT